MLLGYSLGCPPVHVAMEPILLRNSLPGPLSVGLHVDGQEGMGYFFASLAHVCWRTTNPSPNKVSLSKAAFVTRTGLGLCSLPRCHFGLSSLCKFGPFQQPTHPGSKFISLPRSGGL